MSGTNVSDILRDNSKFEDSVLTQDPKIMHEWSNRVWSAIEEGKVFVGMTDEQARISFDTIVHKRGCPRIRQPLIKTRFFSLILLGLLSD